MRLLNEIKEERFIIPFLHIPSGVKPIICAKQIEQFHRFCDKLDNSDILVIMGYHFNSDDNHLNAIVSEWLKKGGRKLIYFNFKGETNFENFIWAEEIKKENKLDLNKTDESVIYNIYIDDDNCKTQYRSVLDKLS